MIEEIASDSNMEGRFSLAILGARGRMGRLVTHEVERTGHFRVVGLWDRVDANTRSGDPVPEGESVVAGVPADWEADAVIDFSTPDALRSLLSGWRGRNSVLVSGTTGIGELERGLLAEAACTSPVLWSANMSTGMVVVRRMLAMAVPMLGPAFDADIVEIHHRNKADAPSGTALALAGTLQDAGKHGKWVTGRDGRCFRADGEIGVLAVRGGDIVGEHEVILSGPGESIRLKHMATSRVVFAAGAVTLARWLCGRAPGLYTVDDWADEFVVSSR